MAKIRHDQPLIPSVLDRLIDEDPTRERDTPKSRTQILRELKQSVRRDLESLLNTRWRCVQWPPEMDSLEISLVDYGIPDFTGINMGQQSERENLRKIIERVIRKFEPRFKTVKVELVSNDNHFDRALRFRIDALLYAEPAPEPVVFDSLMEPTSASIEIRGGRT